MKITILGQSVETENGAFEIGKEHPLFKLVEAEFWDYIKNCVPNPEEYEEMYFGENACYDKTAAIEQAIDYILQDAEESGKKIFGKADIQKMDFTAAFE